MIDLPLVVVCFMAFNTGSLHPNFIQSTYSFIFLFFFSMYSCEYFFKVIFSPLLTPIGRHKVWQHQSGSLFLNWVAAFSENLKPKWNCIHFGSFKKNIQNVVRHHLWNHAGCYAHVVNTRSHSNFASPARHLSPCTMRVPLKRSAFWGVLSLAAVSTVTIV